MIATIASICLLAALRGRLSYPVVELLIEFLFAEVFLIVVMIMFRFRLDLVYEWKGWMLIFSIISVALFSAMTMKKSAWIELGRVNVLLKNAVYALFVIEFIILVITGAIIVFTNNPQKESDKSHSYTQMRASAASAW